MNVKQDSIMNFNIEIVEAYIDLEDGTITSLFVSVIAENIEASYFKSEESKHRQSLDD